MFHPLRHPLLPIHGKPLPWAVGLFLALAVPLAAPGAEAEIQWLAQAASRRLVLEPPRPPRDRPAPSPAERAVQVDFPQPLWGRVSGGNVNIRSGPGTTYGIVITLRSGDFIRATGRRGRWIELEWPERACAWVVKDYVTPEGIITGNRVRLRAGGDLRSPILRESMRGERVEITGSSGGWYKIKAPSGSRAYIYGKYAVLGVRAPKEAAPAVSSAPGSQPGTPAAPKKETASSTAADNHTPKIRFTRPPAQALPETLPPKATPAHADLAQPEHPPASPAEPPVARVAQAPERAPRPAEPAAPSAPAAFAAPLPSKTNTPLDTAKSPSPNRDAATPSEKRVQERSEPAPGAPAPAPKGETETPLASAPTTTSSSVQKTQAAAAAPGLKPPAELRPARTAEKALAPAQPDVDPQFGELLPPPLDVVLPEPKGSVAPENPPVKERMGDAPKPEKKKAARPAVAPSPEAKGKARREGGLVNHTKAAFGTAGRAIAGAGKKSGRGIKQGARKVAGGAQYVGRKIKRGVTTGYKKTEAFFIGKKPQAETVIVAPQAPVRPQGNAGKTAPSRTAPRAGTVREADRAHALSKVSSTQTKTSSAEGRLARVLARSAQPAQPAQGVTHRLLKGGVTVYFLAASPGVDLDAHLGERVRVQGAFEKVPGRPAQALIRVRSIRSAP